MIYGRTPCPWQCFGFALCLALAWLCARWNRRRGARPCAPLPENALSRPRRFHANILLLLSGFVLLILWGISPRVLFLLLALLALLLNVPSPGQRQKIFRAVAPSALPVCLTALSVGIFLGIFEGSGMQAALMEGLLALLPATLFRFLPLLLSLMSTLLLLVLPFQSLYALIPLAAAACVSAGGSPVGSLLPFVLLYPTVYSPLVATTTLIDAQLSQPFSTHLRFSFWPLCALHGAVLAFGALLGLF